MKSTRTFNNKRYSLACIVATQEEIKKTKWAYKQDGYSVRVTTRSRKCDGFGEDYPVWTYKKDNVIQ